MQKRNKTIMSVRTIAGLLIIIGSLAGKADGSIIFNFQDQGSDLLVTVSGSLDETGLSLNNIVIDTTFSWPMSMNQQSVQIVSTGRGSYRAGPHGATQHFELFSNKMLSVTGAEFSGDLVGVNNWVPSPGNVAVPISYAGGELSGYTLYPDINISDIGVRTGTWLTFSNGETVEITAIPEPATAGLIGLFAGGLYFMRRFFRE